MTELDLKWDSQDSKSRAQPQGAYTVVKDGRVRINTWKQEQAGHQRLRWVMTGSELRAATDGLGCGSAIVDQMKTYR